MAVATPFVSVGHISKTSSTAEECATQIKARWAKFVDAQERRAERLESQKATQKQAIHDAERDAEQEKQSHRNDKLFLAFVALVGWAVAIIAVMHH